jgi:hypothetical protein
MFQVPLMTTEVEVCWTYCGCEDNGFKTANVPTDLITPEDQMLLSQPDDPSYSPVVDPEYGYLIACDIAMLSAPLREWLNSNGFGWNARWDNQKEHRTAPGSQFRTRISVC